MFKRLDFMGFFFLIINTQTTLDSKTNKVAGNTLIAKRNLNKRGYDKFDQLATQLCQTTPNIFLGLLFPTTMELKLDQVRDIIRQNGTLFHEKKIHLHADGFKEFISQLPTKRAKWWQEYFPEAVKNKHPLHVFLFTCPAGVKQVLSFKDTIRKLYHPVPGIMKNIKRTFHTTDTAEETLQVAQIVFNEQSLHFINTQKTFPTTEDIMILKNFIASSCSKTNLAFTPKILSEHNLKSITRSIVTNQLTFEQLCASYASNAIYQRQYFYYYGLKFYC